ncbi:hypothetical protein CEXT_42021 [Caerostris extrusa]|uniref:Uncharacterized protein n=1 Tax=Caerostris extrusa TaxID=172846 RepID=A0AAV4W367_CAEEX|nr:hypothetical protein CEXT_42021 [Caerostris extrusa]
MKGPSINGGRDRQFHSFLLSGGAITKCPLSACYPTHRSLLAHLFHTFKGSTEQPLAVKCILSSPPPSAPQAFVCPWWCCPKQHSLGKKKEVEIIHELTGPFSLQQNDNKKGKGTLFRIVWDQ